VWNSSLLLFLALSPLSKNMANNWATWTTFFPRNCLSCGGPTSRHITKEHNPNGNAGRPFYSCDDLLPWVKCGEFSSFGDTRGIHDGNPPCDCGVYSRVQLAGAKPTTQIPRSVHFRCAIGRCRFFAYLRDAAGDVFVYKWPIKSPEEMAAMGL
jgi:hypothetical protein